MSFQDQENKPSEQDTDQLTFKVGEREFNAESAASKISAADEHIKKIEQENADARAKLASLEAQLEQSTKIEDALQKLQQQQPTSENQPTEPTSSVSEEQIGAIATKQIEEFLAQQRAQEAQKAQETLAEQTFRETSEKLNAQFGDKTDEVMKAKAQEMGIGFEDLLSLAKQPATAKLLLQSVEAKPSASHPSPSGSLNTAGINNQAEKLIDYSPKITSTNIMDALEQHGATYN